MKRIYGNVQKIYQNIPAATSYHFAVRRTCCIYRYVLASEPDDDRKRQYPARLPEFCIIPFPLDRRDYDRDYLLFLLNYRDRMRYGSFPKEIRLTDRGGRA
jgi:hypothetical protein